MTHIPVLLTAFISTNRCILYISGYFYMFILIYCGVAMGWQCFLAGDDEGKSSAEEGKGIKEKGNSSRSRFMRRLG